VAILIPHQASSLALAAPPSLIVMTMVILDPVDVFKYGIEKAGHPSVWSRCSLDKISRLDDGRFRQAFGIGPNAIVITVFEDIQNVEIMGDSVIVDANLRDFMMSLRWLRVSKLLHRSPTPFI